MIDEDICPKLLALNSCFFFICLQCKNGHTVCEPCCQRINNRCPTCKDTLDIRNLILKKIMESMKVGCSYAGNGCKEIMPFLERTSHEKNCNHAPCYCPFESCYFKGYSLDLFNHIKDAHAFIEVKHREYKSHDFKVDKMHFLLGDDCSIYVIVVKKLQSIAFCVSLFCFSSLPQNEVTYDIFFSKKMTYLTANGTVPNIKDITELSALQSNVLIPYTMLDANAQHVNVSVRFEK